MHSTPSQKTKFILRHCAIKGEESCGGLLCFVGDLNVAEDGVALARAMDSSKISAIWNLESLVVNDGDDLADPEEWSLPRGNVFR